jgi:hypothetical protein
MARYRRKALVLGIVLALLVGAGWLIYDGSVERRSKNLGCQEGGLSPTIVPDGYQDDLDRPYGQVHSCRRLDREGHLFGKVEISVYVLLETDRGTVAVRLDYHNLDAGRQYVAQAVELDGTRVEHLLSGEERRDLNRDLAIRGGARSQVWTLSYGDG